MAVASKARLCPAEVSRHSKRPGYSSWKQLETRITGSNMDMCCFT